MTAKTNGLEDLAQEVLETAGLTEEDVAHMEIPSKPSKIAPPPVVTPAYQYNWPIVGATESFFDRALTAAANGDSTGIDYQSNGIEAQGANGLDEWAGEAGADDVAAEEAEDAWDLAADEPEQIVGEDEDAEAGETEPDAPLSAGISESALWVRNSPLAADHVAAGSFETAMQVRCQVLLLCHESNYKLQILNRQVGVVNFAPLKPLFLSVYRSSRLYLPANASLPPLEVHLRRNPDESEGRSVLPVSARTLQSIVSGELRTAYAAFKRAAFVEAADTFRSILQSLLLVVASSPAEDNEVSTAP